ncbi:glutathione S-transferase family protein [Breoghania sp. L-A4]|uniref:glutathione S-transferase family protein n=1 Tax=Breoghania sp. L-A4 TaxID=2304600 RepID=UPI000E358502|nr:glutathione S-transferase family protein [Breoghania sp. L-A4]AXS41428.1 glutathione S-transferase family protein [Breoghania sp. L-A4]
MLVLRSSPASPFGRKVKLAAAVVGLYDQIDSQNADTIDPNDTLRQQNPLGKIPVLINEDGEAFYDSRVIVEYLDHLAGGGIVIPNGPRRYEALRMQALADGILDAALLCVYEKRFRPEEKWHQPWTDRQAEKITRGLDVLEEMPPALGKTLDIGAIAVACALGYLDLRLGGEWRAHCPKLVAWLDDFAARLPAFAKTHMDPQ